MAQCQGKSFSGGNDAVRSKVHDVTRRMSLLRTRSPRRHVPIARVEAQFGSFGEKPPSVEMQALRNIAAASHPCELVASGRQITVEDIQDIHHALIGEDDLIAGRLGEGQNWTNSKSMAGPQQACHSSVQEPQRTSSAHRVYAER